MNETESHFKKHYPILSGFLENTLWPDVDGYNPIALLLRIAYHGHPERSLGLIRELKDLSEDDAIENQEISRLFNKEETGFPYEVVTEENAKSFCFSMQESLAFIVSLKNNS